MEFDIYSLVKAFHIIAIVCWFAGLFYLPRLFVYHVKADKKSIEMLSTMENKLYRYIMNPSMKLTWLLGGILIYLNQGWLESGWLHAKIFFVVLLTGYHHICGSYVKKIAVDQNFKTEKYFRWFNEAPTLLLFIIVFLVVLKPF